MTTLHHIGLWVKDLDRSGRFYHDIMGFERQYRYRAPAELIGGIFRRPVGCQVEVYQRDEVRLELFQPDKEMADSDGCPLSPGINHFSLAVPDKIVFCRDAQDKGAELIEVDRGDHKAYFIRDPDGILIEMKDE